MHEIEPFYHWRELYRAEDDPRSPFYGNEYSEFMLSQAVYNYYIHPQWDNFGSATLYCKLLMVNYDLGYAIIEFIGEWNDTLYNDIMYLYQGIAEPLMDEGIRYFILIGENVLNFHADSADYYEEWFDNLDDGWIAGLNFRTHVLEEIRQASIDYYIAFGGKLDHLNWRGRMPDDLFLALHRIMTMRLE